MKSSSGPAHWSLRLSCSSDLFEAPATLSDPHPSEPYANMRSVMIACVLLPRFQLTVALEGRAELLQAPTALAPEPGGTQQIGEVSLSAEAFGVHPGMRLGEALARCPRLDARRPRSRRRRRLLGAAAGTPGIDGGGRRARAAGARLLRRARAVAVARRSRGGAGGGSAEPAHAGSLRGRAVAVRARWRRRPVPGCAGR